MQRVRRGRSYQRVDFRRRQSSSRQLRIVIGMDQVVRDSRVLRVSAKERLKQIRRLLLIGMRFICRRCIGQQRQRIKHLSFHIREVVLRQSLHRVLVIRRSGAISHRSGILIDQA